MSSLTFATSPERRDIKHDYVSDGIPTPTIKAPDTIVEDVAGSLTGVHLDRK